jgi:hypothetical protein
MISKIISILRREQMRRREILMAIHRIPRSKQDLGLLIHSVAVLSLWNSLRMTELDGMVLIVILLLFVRFLAISGYLLAQYFLCPESQRGHQTINGPINKSFEQYIA